MADPSTWWGTRSVSRSVQPVRDPDQPVPVSSSIVERVRGLPDAVVPRPRGRGRRPASTSRPTSARWCTRSPSGSPPGSCEPGPDGRRRADGPRREGLGPAGVPDAVGQGTRARADPVGTGAVPAPGTTPTRARWSASSSRSARSSTCPNGERVPLDGYADRLELDADGRVVVVDLKTGRTKPSDKSVLTNVQLGLYQLAVDHGAVDDLVDQDGARPAAPSWCSSGSPATTSTPPSSTSRTQADDGAERTALRGRLARAAALLRTRELPRDRRPALPRLRLRPDLPDQERRARWSASVTAAAPHRHAGRPRRGDGDTLGGQRAAVGRDHRAPRARGRHRRGRLRQDHADGRPGRLPRADRPGAARPGARSDLHDQGGQRAARPDPPGADRRGRAGRRPSPRSRTSSSPPSRPTTPTPRAC